MATTKINTSDSNFHHYQNCVGRWNIGGKSISVLEGQGELKYSVEEGDNTVNKDLTYKFLYGAKQSIRLIKLFHEVIQKNLEHGVAPALTLPSMFGIIK